LTAFYIDANLICLNIYSKGGKRNINAGNIDATDISYFAVCFACQGFKCKSVKGERNNCKHFCLDKEIEFIKEEAEEDDKTQEVTMIKEGKKYRVKILEEIE